MKLLLTGAGFIMQDFLSFADDLKDKGVELTAITGVPAEKDKMEEFKEKHGIQELYVDYDEALKNTAADTVYIGVPNFLHYSFAKKALEAGKNVICEKPFTVKYAEFKELKQLAIEKNLVLVEAITNQYLTNYKELKDNLKSLGPVRIVSMNYSQYSHRYNAFKEGKVLPVFDPKKGGGALMDLNIYNIHFLVGLFGMPKKVHYLANIQRGVDTSGVLMLDYGDFKAVSIGAKDCAAPITSTIEGEDGSIVVNGPANVMDSFDMYHEKDLIKHVDDKIYPHRMYEEFINFAKIVDQHDMATVKKMLDHSDEVMQVVQQAVDDAGLELE